MNNFIQNLKDIWSIVELRNKILYTLALILVYRFGTFVVLPGIDSTQLSKLADSSGGIFGLFNMFAGGAFSRASVFALGVMPYISASIVVQLLTIAVPSMMKLQKEGESGRKKINQLTRYLTVLVTLFQASAYVQYLYGTLGDSILMKGFWFWLTTTIVLTGGTIFVMWLGEKITDRGLGNGTSLLIMSGIISSLPGSFVGEVTQKISGTGGGLLMLLVEIILLVAVVFVTIALIQAVRRVPVNHAKRMVSGKEYGGGRQYIPLKVNISGVMPIIFAQAMLFIPTTIAQVAGSETDLALSIQKFLDYTSVPYNILMFLMVVLFTFFYTALIVNPTQMADDLKRNNGYIPSVKPGPETAEYLDAILSKITFPGAIILGLIAIMPAFAKMIGVNQQFAVFFGGTSLIITISVILDTLQQVDSYLLLKHYDGLTHSGTRIRGRVDNSSPVNIVQ